MAVELLVDRLWWLPSSSEVLTPRVQGIHVFSLKDYAEDRWLRGGEYAVAHYAASAVGRAIGPLGLDQVARFCHLLKVIVETREKVMVVADAGVFADRMNLAVLLAAYLMLCHEWPLSRVQEALREEAVICFPCSWAPSQSSSTSDCLKVQDCWSGLDAAIRLNWIRAECVGDSTSSCLACSQYRSTLESYDASWVAQGILVSADPLSTVRDPNPVTVSALTGVEQATEPDDEDVERWRWGSPSVFSDDEVHQRQESPDGLTEVAPHSDAPDGASPCSKAKAPSSELPLECHVMLPARNDGASEAQWSCDTICKEYVDPSDSVGNHEAKQFLSESFVGWCVRNHVGIVVRANYGDEPGLEEYGGSYDPAIFRPAGITQHDLQVADKQGGVPSAETLRRFFAVTCHGDAKRKLLPSAGDSKSLLIHCKGGFGRSVVFASCLLIHRFDLPGRTVLGWMRMARPGAITTTQQELFLCSLCGRADVKSYVEQTSSGCTIG